MFVSVKSPEARTGKHDHSVYSHRTGPWRSLHGAADSGSIHTHADDTLGIPPGCVGALGRTPSPGLRLPSPRWPRSIRCDRSRGLTPFLCTYNFCRSTGAVD